MRARIGVRDMERVRVLPPLEPGVLRALRRLAVAVLDPFPVGLHLPVLAALQDRVPVVTAPALQECTNSHAFNLAHHMRAAAALATATASTVSTASSPASTGFSAAAASITPGSRASTGRAFRRGSTASAPDAAADNYPSQYPSTPEDYGVLAVMLQRDDNLRAAFSAGSLPPSASSPASAMATAAAAMTDAFAAAAGDSQAVGGGSGAEAFLEQLTQRSKRGKDTHGAQFIDFISTLYQ